MTIPNPKKKFRSKVPACFLSALYLFLMHASVFAHAGYAASNSLNPLFMSCLGAPDTIFPDSTVYQQGDTVEIYADGSNTVYVLYADSLSDSTYSMFDLDFTLSQPNILIEIGADTHPVVQGLFGVNLTNMFTPTHANENELDGIYGTDLTPWDYLVDLAPNVLRWPSGAGGTFMHPLGYEVTDEADDDYGKTYGGYGYAFQQMIPFFDVTNGLILDAPALSLIIDDVSDGTCNDCADWMLNNDVLKSELVKLYGKWWEQNDYNTPYVATGDLEDQDELYINQFIRLIKAIEDGNPGHTVDVIYCADILGQTASEATEVVKYLRDNDIYDVHVVGVELGNETYGRIFQATMGFIDFEHYWKYINGDDYDGLTGDFGTDELEAALPSAVLTDHDFILKFKGDPELCDILIGLPAFALHNRGN